MFGHDDATKPQNNLPDPVPDEQLDTAADSMDSSVVSSMNDTAAASVAPAADPTAAPVLPDTPTVTPAVATPAAGSDDLLALKQQALQQLTPLMEHLDQTPEERFRTTMMMIQASDNQALIKSAYDAALAIPDEKVRAQALLDVVNEINYFTTAGSDAAADEAAPAAAAAAS